MQYKGKLYAGDGKTFVELEKTAKDFDNMEEALKILQSLNPIKNYVDAYLYDIAEWGLGNMEQKPDPSEYYKVEK